jgi:tetratricopeptide (TPR) repeat protein
VGQRRWARSLVVAGLLVMGRDAAAQFPDEFTNLEVLPKDIAKRELESTMRRFAFALGVRCDHCHVEKAGHGFEYAADDKETKRTARVMLRMVAAANRDFIDKIEKTDHEPARVECVTCHHGLARPRTLHGVLAEDDAAHGIGHALALYDELRGKYYGTGQYDFGETTLNQLAERLLAEGRKKEALAVMEKHFAANDPRSLWSFHMLAQAHEANGERDKAVADYRRVLELHPDDTWAREQIEALTKPRP